MEELAPVRKVTISLESVSDSDPFAWVVIRCPVDLSDPVDQEMLKARGILP
jgi:hypothetical protein